MSSSTLSPWSVILMTEAVEKIKERREDLVALSQTDLPVADVADQLLGIAKREAEE